MGSRYDTRTTTFSPEGQLFQVSYAMRAISQGASAVGILAADGVVLAAEKRFDSKLLDVRSKTEKLFKIDNHIAVAIAGITSDANILLDFCRKEAQRYLYLYGDAIPVENLMDRLSDLTQSYTQLGGLRPFGVSFLTAGWDERHGFQLMQSDPSGNYGGWKARAVGANSSAAQSLLKDDYKEGCDLKEAQMLALKTLSKTMDNTSPTSENLEFATVTRNAQTNEVEYKVMSKAELNELLKEAAPMLKAAQAEASDL